MGFNLKMNALCASLGIAQLKKIKKILKSKRKIFNYYKTKFKHSSEIKLICSKDKQIPNHWINTIMFKNINKKKRDYILKRLNSKGLESKPIWYPIHKMKSYRNFPKMNLRNSEVAYIKCINIPSTEKKY